MLEPWNCHITTAAYFKNDLISGNLENRQSDEVLRRFGKLFGRLTRMASSLTGKAKVSPVSLGSLMCIRNAPYRVHFLLVKFGLDECFSCLALISCMCLPVILLHCDCSSKCSGRPVKLERNMCNAAPSVHMWMAPA